MKQSEFNPLRRALALSPLEGPHPDSDILTAFAEGKLLQRERTEVFAHLATCAECREVISVATEAAPIPASGTKPFLLPRSTHQSSRAWLPWASIAAGIIVVCSAGLIYKQKLESRQRATVATENAPAIPSAANTRQKESPPPPVPAVASGNPAAGAIPSNLKTPVLAKESSSQKPENQELSSLAVQSGLARQNSRIQDSSAAETTHGEILARPPAPVQAGSAFVSAEAPRATAQASLAAVARPHWRINSLGQAERSFGNEAWQAVLSNESSKMHVVSVFNGDVWIGGENTRLYHSVDNGSTWVLVALPQRDGREHVIAHIRFQTSQAGTVEAEDGVTWTTDDGGISWN
jgi:hypothetical protein